MIDRVLVVNPGSSSLKLSVVAPDGSASGTTAPAAPDGIAAALRAYGEHDRSFQAIGVRVVHGGDRFRHSTVVTPSVLEQLHALSELAPLHTAAAVAALVAVAELQPHVAAVACFDTAFHATLPPAAATYALPEAWRRAWPLRRFGFHGLSHAYASRRAAQLMERPGDASLRLVTCHLGAGASLAAVVGGASVDTTMGFTPLEGLVMATRSGSLDPGLVLWLSRHSGLTTSAIEDSLERGSGLLGVAGTPSLSEVLERAARGDERSVLARDMYVHRLCGLIATMAASAQGVDGVVFTGGVGEGSAELRQRVCDRLGHLGVAIDTAANVAWAGEDGSIAGAGSAVEVMVVVAREDIEIAREVRAVLDGQQGQR